MKESVFQYELKKTIEDEGGWCEKFPDMPRFKGSRFIPEKCADYSATVNGRPILIECKLIKKVEPIHYKFFESSSERKEKLYWTEYHQVRELKRFNDNHPNNQAYYAINLRIPYKVNQLIILHIEMFMSMYLKSDYISKEQLIVLAKNGIHGTKKRFPGITKKL
ncbi:MAG: hypothetical protein PVF17_00950 [Ignavibacteria bacterium]|jgi:hypothetical protein